MYLCEKLSSTLAFTARIGPGIDISSWLAYAQQFISTMLFLQHSIYLLAVVGC